MTSLPPQDLSHDYEQVDSNEEGLAQQTQPNTPPSSQLQPGAPPGAELSSILEITPQTTTTTPSSLTTDQEKHKLIQQQLVLLLHAHKCQRRESLQSDVQQCNLPHCTTMKNVLNHMVTCDAVRTTCSVPHCSESRKIILHWRHCLKTDCPVCTPLMQADRMKHSNGGDLNSEIPHMSYLSRPTATAQTAANSQQAVANMHHSLLSFPSNSSTTPRNMETVEQLPDGLEVPVIFQSEHRTARKEWQLSVTKELRDHLVLKLVQAIFPSPDPIAMRDKRMHNLGGYARQVESDIYELANSRSEYYHLIAEKIYKIQRDMEEKRQERRVQQVEALQALQHQPSQLSNQQQPVQLSTMQSVSITSPNPASMQGDYHEPYIQPTLQAQTTTPIPHTVVGQTAQSIIPTPVSPLGQFQQRTMEAAVGAQSGQPPRGTCSVCLDNEATHVIIPCGHLCLCQVCSFNLQYNKCPICTLEREAIYRVYFP